MTTNTTKPDAANLYAALLAQAKEAKEQARKTPRPTQDFYLGNAKAFEDAAEMLAVEFSALKKA